VALAEEELKKDGGNAHQWLAAAEFCSLIRQLATQLLADPYLHPTDDVSLLALFPKDIQISMLRAAWRASTRVRSHSYPWVLLQAVRRELSRRFPTCFVRARESHH
jgi:hypothetical protein